MSSTQSSHSPSRGPSTAPETDDRAQIHAALRATVGHPALVKAELEPGTRVLNLSGTIFEHEVEALLSRLKSLRFVREVQNSLHTIRLESLGSDRRGKEFETYDYESNYLETSWPLAFRWIIGGISALSLYRGMTRKGTSGTLLGASALALLSRAAFNRDLAQLFGALVLPVIRIHRAFIVDAPVEDCYDFWSRFDNYKLFMSFIEDVTVTENGYLHWIARLPGRARLQWDCQVTSLRPLQRVAWKSVNRALIANAGMIEFEPLGAQKTRIRIELSYIPPAGALGYLVAKGLGFDPGHHIDEDLEVMRLLLEQPRERRSDRHSPIPPPRHGAAA